MSIRALDGDLVLDPGGMDLLEDPADEERLRRCLLGGASLDLGLYVELDLLGVVALDHVQDVLELDHSEALDLLLLGEAGQLR